MPKVSGSYSGDGIQAVLLAFQILEHFAQQPGSVGITELAKKFGTSKSRIHRHIQTLIEGGYVVQDSDGERYRLTARLIALGEAVSENFDIAVAARPALADLHAELGHGVAISIPEGDGVRIVSVMRSTSNIEIGVKQGSLLPYHSSSQGKVAMAFGGKALYDRALSLGLPATTPATVADEDALSNELDRIRQQGWATSGDQTVTGLNALAAPVFDGLGDFAGAVAIVDSVQFIPDTPSKDQLQAVLSAAGRISQGLGFTS